jgi:hypothetical protein
MPRKPSKYVQELQRQVDTLQKALSDQANRIDLSEKARTWLRLSQLGSSSVYRSTTFTGNGFFSPGEPILPIDPEVEPRLFEYGAGFNLVYIPRAGYGLLPYQVLRNLGAMSKEIRLNIEKVKQIIRGYEWDIIFEGPEVQVQGITYQATPDIERIKHFWDCPDGVHDFDSWLAIVLEEILVTDALTFYPNRSDHEFALEVVDGTTIRPLIDFHGRIPKHPAPAYVQVLHGVPTSYYSQEGLMYFPRNPRVYTPYGESPIEWVLQMIVQSIKHDLGRTNYFTEGNVPGAFAGLPAEWTVQQIQEFSDWYNAILNGDIARSNKLMFIPHSGSSLPIHEFNQSSYADPAIDEWLMTIACWAYGNSPSEFGLTRGSGLGGAGYMSAGENAQFRGVLGIAKFLARVINKVNKDFLNAPWAKFKWKEFDPIEDQAAKADVHLKYVGKIYTAAYVQDQLGIPEKYRVKETSSDPVLSDPVSIPNQNSFEDSLQSDSNVDPNYDWRQAYKELRLYRKFVSDALRKGWKIKKFVSNVIPQEILSQIEKRLHEDPQSYEKIFEEAFKKIRANPHEAIIKQMENQFTEEVAQYLLEAQSRVESELTK